MPSAWSSRRRLVGAIDQIGEMLSRPRKPPAKRLLPSGSWRLSHQVKFSNSFWKTRSRKSRSRPPSMTNTRRAASAWTGGLTSSKLHSYAGSAPFGAGTTPQQHQQLILGERWIQMCPRDGVERQVPCCEPRVLPRIRHRQHVERVQMAPARIAAVAVTLRRGRLCRIAVEPAPHLVGVDLLAPDQAGARLPQDSHLLGAHLGRRESGVELICIRFASGHHVVEGVTEPELFADRRPTPADAAAAAPPPCHGQAPSARTTSTPGCRAARGSPCSRPR